MKINFLADSRGIMEAIESTYATDEDFGTIHDIQVLFIQQLS